MSLPGGSWPAKARKIKTGLSYRGSVEVLEGLKAGDQLIAEAVSTWCSLDAKTRRPLRLRPETIARFGLVR